jgi:hypothetical protein
MSKMPRIDRYLAVVDRAKRLCTHGGFVVLYVGNKPAPYVRIERLAYRKYLE